MKNQKGFTLIELLIVIGIIAILAAAVIIAINPGRQFEQARNATRWSHMNSVVNAVYSYAISEGGTFPDCVGDTAQDLAHCQSDLVDEGYMSELPQDPSVGGEDNDNCDTSGDLTAEDCTGYIISLEGENRVKIVSDADEASDVEVVQ